MINWLLAFSSLIILIQSTPTIPLVQTEEKIQVISTDIENDFPNSLTFQISIQSEEPIDRINLYYKFQGSISTQSQPVDFEPSNAVSATYVWDTSSMTIAPSSPIYYYWKIVDQDGNSLTTPEELIYYDDIRFDWQELSSPKIILRWYEGDEEFGINIFNIAQQALIQMEEQTNRQMDFPIIIMLYANEDDFSSWHYYVHDWAGGLAFPSLGVTTQIVSPFANQLWVENVIPHEIAHLFFYQIINTDSNYWPTWLDEGLAQYYEFSPNDIAIERVSQAAQDGNLLPLVLISGDFGSDPDHAHLAYDEAYTIVVYLIETWGNDGLQKLVTNFRDGKGYRDAVEEAFGVTWEEFEASWITWLGVPTTPAPPPTSTPTKVYMKAPEGWPTPTKVQTSDTKVITTMLVATDTPKISVSTAVPTPIQQNTKADKKLSLPIVGVVGLLFLFVIFVILYRQSKN